MFLDKYILPTGATKAEKNVITAVEIFAVFKGIQWYNKWNRDRKLREAQEKLALQQLQMQTYATLPGQTVPPPNTTVPGGPAAMPGGGLTYAPAAYTNMADAIENALQTGFFEDWDGVVTVFKKLKTLDDYTALDSAFGDRSNYVLGIPKYEANLAYWLNDEMGGSSQLNQINSYLQTQKIPIVF